MSQNINLFVFGTLREGLPLHYYMAEATRVADGTTTGNMYSMYGSYPVVNFNGSRQVVGEVYSIDMESRLFRRLLEMELGAGYEFRIVEVTPTTTYPPHDDEPAEEAADLICATFDWQRDNTHLDRVRNGDWKVHEGRHGTNAALFTNR